MFISTSHELSYHFQTFNHPRTSRLTLTNLVLITCVVSGVVSLHSECGCWRACKSQTILILHFTHHKVHLLALKSNNGDKERKVNCFIKVYHMTVILRLKMTGIVKAVVKQWFKKWCFKFTRVTAGRNVFLFVKVRSYLFIHLNRHTFKNVRSSDASEYQGWY